MNTPPPACLRHPFVVSLIALLAHLSSAAEPYTEKPGTEGDGSHKVGPEYKIDPDLTDKGNAKGRQFEHCDRRAFEQTLAHTLVWTWRGYHAD